MLRTSLTPWLAALAALTFSTAPVPTSATPPTLQLTPSSVVGGNAVIGTVSLAVAAPVGGTTVTVTTSSIAIAPLVNLRLGASSAVTSLTVLVAQGQTAAPFRINTPGVATTATATITAVASGEATNATLTVLPASVASVSVVPITVTGSQAATATVVLDGKAPPTAVSVSVSASVNLGTIVGASTTAPKVTVPQSVTVAGGASSANFQVTTSAVSTSTSAVITASLGRSASAPLTVVPPTPVAVQFNPSAIVGGSQSTGTVVLSAAAPTEGIAVGLTSSTASLTTPASITVPGGTDRQTFTVSTTSVGSSVRAAVTAQSAIREAISRTTVLPDLATGFLTIDPPPKPSSVLLSSAFVIGGTSSMGTVVLSGPALAGGLAVSLASSSGAVVLPPSITVPAGLDRQQFQFTTRPVATSSQVTISAKSMLAGSVTSISDGTSNTIQPSETRPVSATLNVLEQPVVQSVVVQPSAVTGGNSVTIAVTYSTSTSALSTDALAVYAQSIRVSTNHPELLLLATVSSGGFSTTSSGTTSGTSLTATGGFTATATAATTAPTSDQSVSATAIIVTSSRSTTFLVRAPVPPIASFTLRPTTATGGTNIVGSLVLSSAITTSQTIQLTTDRPDVVHVPASVVVVPGRAFGFTVSTTSVQSQTPVTITAIAGAQKVPVIVQVVP